MLFKRMDKKRAGCISVKDVSNTVKELCPNTTSYQLVILEQLINPDKTGDGYDESCYE